MIEVGLIGPGRVGKTLATLLPTEAYHLGPVLSRDFVAARRAVREMKYGWPTEDLDDFASCDLTLLACPEHVIDRVLLRMARSAKIQDGAVVLHTSGVCEEAASPAALDRLCIGRFLPIQIFRRPLVDLLGIQFILSGDPIAVRAGRGLAQAYGGQFTVSDVQGKNEACMATALGSDVLTAILELAVRKLVRCGLRRKRAKEAVEALVVRSLQDFGRSGGRVRPGPLARALSAGETCCDGTHAESGLFHRALALSRQILKAGDDEEQDRAGIGRIDSELRTLGR